MNNRQSRSVWIVVFVLSIAAISCSDNFESKYATNAQAQKGDEGHGWLPPFLPKTAREIQEVHNLDSNRVWGTFIADDATLPVFASCANPATVPVVHVGNPPVTWWPKQLKGEVRSSTGSWSLYKCAGSEATLIAPADRRNRYYWVQ